MRVERPRVGVLIIDGAFEPADLARCTPPPNSFRVQQLGGGRGRDGLPERREHARRDDPEVAALIWQRLEPHLAPLPSWFEPAGEPRLEPSIDAWSLDRCNERIRAYRYGIGDRFAPHFDESFRPGPGQRTFLTVLLYLPTGRSCTGGETVIDDLVVPSVPGRVVVFDHRLIHEGRPVESGEKLVLRTDVIARAKR